jgi:ubiquitin-protein ligase
LLLARPLRAAADPWRERLKREWAQLEQLNRDSDTVKAEVVETAGGVPKVIRFRFFCKGIAGTDSGGKPRYRNDHSCRATLTQQFPAAPPPLYWETEIWHPNIDHQSRDVCVQAVEWLASHTLVELCLMLFEMVQYKNYHAKSEPPYPKDAVVARWVRDVGEPNKYMDKAKRLYVDDQPFTRPLSAPAAAARPVPPPLPVAAPKIRVLTASAAPPAPSGPIRIGTNRSTT